VAEATSPSLQVQQMAGIPDATIARVERFIRPAMPDQHRNFFKERDVLYVAVQDTAGAGIARAGILAGPKGERNNLCLKRKLYLWLFTCYPCVLKKGSAILISCVFVSHGFIATCMIIIHE
jgi:hypothetical protein